MNEIKLNQESLTAFARLIVTLIVSVATVLGWSLDGELWFNIVFSALSIYLIVREAWWKNQNVTSAAQKGQEVVDAEKAGKNVTIEISGDES